MASGREDLRETSELSRVLAELAGATMPFGRYGPSFHPPRGVPLVDLPYEYLAWFARTGFPRGRLGELLRFVYQVRQDGAEALFEPLRAARGGAVSLRGERRRRWSFGDDGSPPGDA